jgi:hypothetical protein
LIYVDFFGDGRKGGNFIAPQLLGRPEILDLMSRKAA